MPTRYLVTFKGGHTKADKTAYIEKVKSGGGTIVKEYTLIPTVLVELPDGYMGALANDPVVEAFEKDSVVTTQS